MDTDWKPEEAESALSPLPSPAFLSLSPILPPLSEKAIEQDLPMSPTVSEPPPLRWLRPTPILSP